MQGVVSTSTKMSDMFIVTIYTQNLKGTTGVQRVVNTGTNMSDMSTATIYTQNLKGTTGVQKVVSTSTKMSDMSTLIIVIIHKLLLWGCYYYHAII